MKTAVNMEQPCDAYFLRNSELNSPVDAPNNRTELQIKKYKTLLMNTDHLLLSHACSRLFQIIPF